MDTNFLGNSTASNVDMSGSDDEDDEDRVITRITDMWIERDDDRQERFCCTVNWKHHDPSSVFMEQVIECGYTIDKFVQWVLRGCTSLSKARAGKRSRDVGHRPSETRCKQAYKRQRAELAEVCVSYPFCRDEKVKRFQSTCVQSSLQNAANALSVDASMQRALDLRVNKKVSVVRMMFHMGLTPKKKIRFDSVHVRCPTFPPGVYVLVAKVKNQHDKHCITVDTRDPAQPLLLDGKNDYPVRFCPETMTWFSSWCYGWRVQPAQLWVQQRGIENTAKFCPL